MGGRLRREIAGKRDGMTRIAYQCGGGEVAIQQAGIRNGIAHQRRRHGVALGDGVFQGDVMPIAGCIDVHDLGRGFGDQAMRIAGEMDA